MLATLDQMAAFAHHCQRYHQIGKTSDSNYVVMNEVEPLKKKYRDIFGEEISGALICKIVSRGLYHELPDGWAMAVAVIEVPDYLKKTIEYCGIESEYRLSQTIDNINVGPDVPIFVWKM